MNENFKKNNSECIISKLFNVKEIANYLGVSVNTIYQWVNRRKIPYIKLGGALRFNTLEIDLWLKSKIIKPICD